MTLAVQTPRVVYAGTGTTGPFQVRDDGGTAISFTANSHIHVARVSALYVQTDLVEGVDYTLTGGPDAGVVTTTAAVAVGETLIIWREQTLAQDTDFGINDPYSSTVHETAFDRFVRLLQEIKDDFSRAIKLSRAYPDATTEVAGGSTNGILGIGADGGIVVLDPAEVDGLTGALGVRPISQGGTGATTAAGARTNLGLGELATKNDCEASDIATAHAATSHDTIIRAYNQANGQTVRQDIGLWVVESATTSTVPGTVTNGAAYLLPADAPSNANKIAHGESGAWVYYNPAEGMEARAKDTDFTYYYDGSAWVQSSGGSVTVSLPYAPNDARIVRRGKVNGGGTSAKYQAAVTADGRLLVWGDNSAFAFNPVGDKYDAYEIPLPWASTVSIEAVYCGNGYILVQTSEATENLWHIGAGTNGVAGDGATSANTVLTRVNGLSSVKILSVVNEAGLNNTECFWFAVTTTGRIYSCGYSGAQHVMGYNSTTNLSTPRLMTYSDGTTPVTDVAQVYCSTAYAPVWARLTTGKAVRWGAGTDGAHGNNSTSAMTWPDALETAPSSGVDRTDIASIAVTGGNLTTARAVTWILTTAGKVEASGNRIYGNGDGAALASAASNTFQVASGALAALTTTSIVAGGAEFPSCIAITSTGNGYMCGYVQTYALLGNGSTTNLNVFTIFSGLPSGFAGALTRALIAGANTFSAVYLEATIAGVKYLASIGYDGYYQTAKGTTGVVAASQTWGLVRGGERQAISDWGVFGTHQEYGLSVLYTDGELRYAGAHDQGQGGVSVGPLAAVDTLQPVRTGLARMAKPFTPRGAYSDVTEYSYNDVVTNDGSSWVYIYSSASTGNDPPTLPTTSNTYWSAIAIKGSEGADGVSLLWRGAWVTATAYAVQDGVESGGSTYVCTVAHTSGATTQPGVGASWDVNWDLAAQKGSTGAAGANGSNGTNGTNGTDPGIRWLFDASTTMADPGSGDLRLNNATLASVTAIAISDNCGETGNPSVEAEVLSWDDSTSTSLRGTLVIKKASAPQNLAVYSITGSSTNNAGWTQLAVTHVVSNGSFSASDVLSVQFYRTGNKGTDGLGSGDVVGPASATDSGFAKFDGTTGKLLKNSAATVSAATELSGTLAAGNFPALTGDVTTSAGAVATTIANSAVSYAKMQNVSATDKVLGRSTAGAGVVEEITCTAAGRALLDDADASAQRTTLGLGTLATQSGTFSGTSSGTNTGDEPTASTTVEGVVELTTTAEYLANTTQAGHALNGNQVWSAGALTALTDGANIAVDMSTGINFSVTLAGNRTLSNPTNTKVGQSGCFVVTQDATGTRTLAYGTNYEFAGGTAFVLSTTANAKDTIFYWVQSSTSIVMTGILKAVA